MAEKNISQEFRLKIYRWNKLFPWRNKSKWIDEQIAQKGLYDSKLYWTLSYFTSTINGCISTNAFASLIGIPIGIPSSAIGLKIFLNKCRNSKI